jgi:hypothetical protein
MNVFIKQVIIAGGFVLAVATPSFAQTSTFTLSGGQGNYQGVNINAEGESLDAAAGTYVATLGGNSVNVFCVDPNDDINWGTSYQADTNETITTPAAPTNNTIVQINGANYYNGGLATSLTSSDMYKHGGSTVNAQQQSDEVGYLAYEGLSATNLSAANAAAYQVAIWSIIDNDPTTLLAPNTDNAGTVFTYNDPGLVSLVDSDINAALSNYSSNPSESFSDIGWIQAPILVTSSNGTIFTHTQDFAYLTGGSSPNGLPLSTPEPNITAFLASLAAAVGIMLFIKRRSAGTNKI